MIKLAVAITVILTVASSHSLAAQSSLENDVRAEVRRLVDLVNGGNPQALAELYAHRTDVSGAGDGAIARGWPAIGQLFKAIFHGAGRISVTTELVVVTTLRSDAATAVFPYTWIIGAGRGAQTYSGAMTLVYEQTSNGWRIVHDDLSTLPPNGARSPITDLRFRVGEPVRETERCTVSGIIDGDTFQCRRGWRVRLIGIDTPEPSQLPYGLQARAALAELMPVGSEVMLERDVELYDRYLRRLAYVWRGGVLINWAMVRHGWAAIATYPPNVRYVDLLREAQRVAREARQTVKSR